MVGYGRSLEPPWPRSGGSVNLWLMRDAPHTIGRLRVLAFTAIDHRHRFTAANDRRAVYEGNNELLVGPAAGVAICRAMNGTIVLVGCDETWKPVWRVECLHEQEARQQAEFEYAGVNQTWQFHLNCARRVESTPRLVLYRWPRSGGAVGSCASGRFASGSPTTWPRRRCGSRRARPVRFSR